jgi:hypothetical protein
MYFLQFAQTLLAQLVRSLFDLAEDQELIRAQNILAAQQSQ